MERNCEVCHRPINDYRSGKCCSRHCYDARALDGEHRLDLFIESKSACTTLPGRCEFNRCCHNLDADGVGIRALRSRDVTGDNCVLRLVDQENTRTLEEIGAIMGITRERVRQIEANALRSAAKAAKHLYGRELSDVLPAERFPTCDVETIIPIRRVG